MRKVALITGGSSGIGLATARRFATDYAVHVVDLQPTSEFTFHEADVRDLRRAQEVVSSLPRLDVLVTCAGINRDGPVDALSSEQWNQVIGVDLTGTFNYVCAAAPVMKAQKSGRIVTVASTVGLRARRHLTNYVAAKAGVIGLSRGAARDLGKYGINVNSVAPGLVETPLAASIPEEIRKRLLDETALGRFATPEDVAAVIYFLCTDDARHVTGEVIRVDGGQLA